MKDSEHEVNNKITDDRNLPYMHFRRKGRPIKMRYSVIPACAIADKRLTHIDIRVLTILGIHADGDGRCFLNQRKIGEALGLTRVTVCRSLGRLEKLFYILKRDMNEGSERRMPRSVCVYELVVPNPSYIPEGNGVYGCIQEEQGICISTDASPPSSEPHLRHDDESACVPSYNSIAYSRIHALAYGGIQLNYLTFNYPSSNNLQQKKDICRNVELAQPLDSHVKLNNHGENCSNAELEGTPLPNGESSIECKDNSLSPPETSSISESSREQQEEDFDFVLEDDVKPPMMEQDQCLQKQPKTTPKGDPGLGDLQYARDENLGSDGYSMFSTGFPQVINSVYGSSLSESRQNDLFAGRAPSAPQTPPKSPDVGPTPAKRRPKRTSVQIGYTAAFDRFWAAYPAKRGMSRPAALKNWLAQGCEEIAEDVIAGAREYADDIAKSRRDKNWSDGYIKHAQGWLTERRWEGYIAEAQRRERERLELERQIEERRLAEQQRREAEAAAEAARQAETPEERKAKFAEMNRRRLIQDAPDIAAGIVQCAELLKDQNVYVANEHWRDRIVYNLRPLTKPLMPKNWRDFSSYPEETVQVINDALKRRSLLEIVISV